MTRFFLMLSRLCLAAWVGIAVFFVAVVIGLRNPTLFDPDVMRNHPKVLFPLFYGFEFSLLGTALASGLAARGRSVAGNTRYRLGLSLLALALVIATVDYFAIYRPLAEMIARPSLPPEFAAYHTWSMWMNVASLVLCAAAAVLAHWPDGRGESAG